ncbi:MAG TPA: PhoPQ-activated protein PqaA family protein [Steroidobacteraceae bacterium]|jgi:PhoPQ-activated pathogenicity-related protein
MNGTSRKVSCTREGQPRRAVFLVAACALASAALLFGLPATAGDEPTANGALAAYLAAADDSFAWREVRTGRVGSATYVELLMTSQTWRGIPWKHQLFVLRPRHLDEHARQALLFVHGGRWKEEYETQAGQSELPREALLFARLAESIRAPLAVLRQVPFQPIFDRREDALIAYTFQQYLQTGESDWPLLLPMVKSAVRAMDVVQQLTRERWSLPIEKFTVAGASKRGWTSWLTAAIDPRVAGVAPMVIDVLNMKAQMALQRATWGGLSEEIEDYSALDLPKRLESERGRELLSVVDPYSYREQLTDPKLILLSTNDRYWPLDALKLYWPDLPEPKRVLYVPNQGHSLRDVDRVIGALSALHRYSTNGQRLPRLEWTFARASDDLVVKVSTDRPARLVRIWSAHSSDRDFRDAHWRSRRCSRKGDEHVCMAPAGQREYVAWFAEASFRDDHELPFSLSTTVCLATREDSRLEDCK